jgi:aerobic carbon-monoxide dehydrogenase medium subunit
MKAEVTMTGLPQLQVASTVEDALTRLQAAGPGTQFVAGGTWVLRSAHRGEELAPQYVSLSRVPELVGIAVQDDRVSIGALTTHAQLAASAHLTGALAQAAAASGFPGVRSVATLGGNLAARGFSEADLVPALLALEARLELATSTGRHEVAVAEYLAERPTDLIVRVLVPRRARQVSAYRRLTVRGGGEYAVASVAVSAVLDDAGRVEDARVALGAVESVARVSPVAADALIGRPIERTTGREAGEKLALDCRPRDGDDAPGWYRRSVLPALAERVVAAMSAEEEPTG